MDYLEVKIPLSPELTEIIIAELSYLNYDSFEEKEDALMAYIVEKDYKASELEEVLASYDIKTGFSVHKMENKNWNEEWEKNFDPIIVSEDCCVRATFHEPKNLPYEIIINPRMAFGTGHHSTTQLMMLAEFGIDFKNKTVIDAGCGTAVLAVLAKKLGASSVDANDIDEWAYDNAIENCKLNDCKDINIFMGTAAEVFKAKKPVDIILANINKNVLLDEMPVYADLLIKGGSLLLSGFYENDINDIVARAAAFDFKLTATTSKNDWACILLVN